MRKLLDLIPDKYLQLVASIEQYSDIDSMPFDEAVGRLKAYEDRLRFRSGNGSAETSLLLTRIENQQVYKAARGSSGGRGHGLKDRGGRGGRGRAGRGKPNWQRDVCNNNYKPRDKKHIKCFNCENYGHYASECKVPKEKGDKANLVEMQEEEPALLLSIYGEKKKTLVLLNEKSVCPSTFEGTCEAREDVWYLDNGVSNHMTGTRRFFAELDEKFTGKVRLGYNSKVQIAGKGSILMKCKNREQQLISEVYFIPALHSNINDYLMIHDDVGRLNMRVERSRNGLYKIALETTQPIHLTANLDNKAWMWHARLGHANFSTI
ncbi:uncharacterized protein LOC127242564 [Andrographis paniculata]|uniref:uncharacterized protein LOC127242564 n=1 Tax=Andrographis paniculata TaxID=175694 RepID=UPI0021E97DC8|nr:uncharacterized protein LOC127242564 [Andrographis paniculata]